MDTLCIGMRRKFLVDSRTRIVLWVLVLILGQLNESSRCPSLHKTANNFHLSELFNFLFPLVKINLERERERGREWNSLVYYIWIFIPVKIARQADLNFTTAANGFEKLRYRRGRVLRRFKLRSLSVHNLCPCFPGAFRGKSAWKARLREERLKLNYPE